MRKIYFILVMLFLTSGTFGQLLTEDFNYTAGTLLTTNGWTAHSGSGTNAITVTSPGLTYAGHPGSGVGNAISIAAVSGEDDNRALSSAVTSGSIYASFLVNVTAVNGTGDYFIGLLTNSTTFPVRVYARTTTGGFNFGISKTNGTVNYETTVRNLGTTHLIVINYVYNAAAADDVVNLWVNPTLGSTEPTATIPNVNGGIADIATITAFYVRQGTAANMPAAQVDAILVGTTWASVTPLSGGGPALSAGSLASFGNVCINTTAGPNSFTITGANLTTADVTVAALDGFTYSTTSGGTYTSTLTITQPGGAFSQEVFVRFSPTLAVNYSDDIVVGGGGATDITVSASGAGVNSPPTVTAGSASNITGTTADVAGTITADGCSAVTAYGIEYSTTDNFTPGTGTQVAGGALTAGAFTSNLTGLTAAITYYYRAYATNTGGTSYSSQSSFSTLLPEPTNHATVFACGATTSFTIPLTWVDATGGTIPSGYLVKWSDVGFGSITNPVDGTPESNGAGVQNVAAGVQAFTATGLTSGTTYYFKIFPYTNSGAIIDYKVDGTVPQTSCATTSGPIAAWDFFGQASPATFAATTFNANLVLAGNASDITRGAGAASSTGANSFRTVGFQNNGIATSNTDYFQVTLTAQPGFELSLSSIDGNMAGTASFAAAPGVSSQFAYSLDGTNFTLIGSPTVTIGSPAALPLIDLSGVSALQNVAAGTTITLRYYASGQTTTGGWGFNSPSAGVNGLAIYGNLAVSSTPSLAVTPGSLSFGQQSVGSNSTSQSVDLSGVNLTGAPGNITVNAPSADFQVSNDNSTWGPSTTIAYSSATLTATPVYVRFTPQSAGAKSGNVTFSGGGDVTPPTVAVSGTGTIVYYSKAAGNLTDVATWGPNTDGTGTSPANFTADAQVFTVANRAAATLDADWVVSGTGSKVVVGDGLGVTDLTIPSTFTLTGTVDISATGELTLENATIAHTYGTLAAGSTIEFAQTGSYTVPNTITYQNLKLTGGTKTLSGNTTTVNGNLVFDNITLGAPGASPFATIDLNGNLTYTGTVVNPADANSVTLIMNGGTLQTIFGGGSNTARFFRLTATSNTSISLSADVLVGNAAGGGIEIEAGSQIYINTNTITTFAGPVRINGFVTSTGLFRTSGSGNFNVQTTSNSNSNLYFDNVNNQIGSLTVNATGTGVVVIGSNAEVTNLTLTAGRMQIAEGATLNLGTAANLVGTFDNTRYIITAANTTTGSKGFFRAGNIPAGAFTFPVGTSTSYLPVTVNPTVTSDFSVNTFTGITSDGQPNGTAFTAGQKANVVDAVWIVDRNGGAGDVTMTTSWPAALEGANFAALADAQIGIARNDGTNWGTVAGTGDNTANTATRSAISTFSPFGVGQVGQVLPVNFGTVRATHQSSGSIKVEWSNLTELDVVSYTVERSADGRSFTSIGTVNARLNNGGKADYSLIDANPFSGVNFYRIRSLEADAKTKYSIIVRVDTRGGATQLVLYPNPVTGGQLSYSAVNLAKGQYALRIFNAAGQLMYNQAISHPGGSVTEAIPMPLIKTGVYTLQLNSADVNLSRTFVVQ